MATVPGRFVDRLPTHPWWVSWRRSRILLVDCAVGTPRWRVGDTHSWWRPSVADGTCTA